jgi:uncharacterized metal-binding protein YceD (DUF177 family)
VSAFSVNIIGLSLTAHTFDFELGKGFLDKYGRDLIPAGEFKAEVVLDKHETFIEADFKITGKAGLTCDRSLEPFDFPVDIHKRILFKYGDEDKELSDEIILINRDTSQLELGQLMYEFIGLDIPIKKLHPRFQEEENDDDNDTAGKVVYSSRRPDDSNNDDIDPRWEQLKKLK